MNQLDFDRAFPETPDYIATAIELGIRKGKNKMKFRNKMITMGSIAAMIAVVIATALAVVPERSQTPDVLAQPPLQIAGQETMMVYSTEGAGYYHLEENCSGLENAISMPETEAVQMGKKPCPACIPLNCSGHDGEEIEFVYYSQGSKYFHRHEECEGIMPLKGEYFAVTRAFREKEPCPECFPYGIEECVHRRAFVVEIKPTISPRPTITPSPLPTSMPAPEENAELLSGNMPTTAPPEAESRYTPEPEAYVPLISGKTAKQSETSKASYIYDVFYTQNGTYYHSDEHCQGMMNAEAHIREDARRDGKSPCLLCLNVYFTDMGTYYHLLPDCMGMKDAKLRSLEEAQALKKERCPVCLSPETVYATQKGNYFHAVQDCSGMEGAQPTDPESAWNDGKTACPVCITGITHYASALSRAES